MFNIQKILKILHLKFVSINVIYLYTKLHMPSSSGSFITVTQ